MLLTIGIILSTLDLPVFLTTLTVATSLIILANFTTHIHFTIVIAVDAAVSFCTTQSVVINMHVPYVMYIDLVIYDRSGRRHR